MDRCSCLEAGGTLASRELGSRGCLRATSGNTADTARGSIATGSRSDTPAAPSSGRDSDPLRATVAARGATSARRDRMPASRGSGLASRARNAVRQDAGGTHAVAGWRRVDRASSAPHPRGIRSLTKVRRQPKSDQSSAGRRASSRARLARRHPSRGIDSRAEAEARTTERSTSESSHARRPCRRPTA